MRYGGRPTPSLTFSNARARVSRAETGTSRFTITAFTAFPPRSWPRSRSSTTIFRGGLMARRRPSDFSECLMTICSSISWRGLRLCRDREQRGALPEDCARDGHREQRRRQLVTLSVSIVAINHEIHDNLV